MRAALRITHTALVESRLSFRLKNTHQIRWSSAAAAVKSAETSGSSPPPPPQQMDPFERPPAQLFVLAEAGAKKTVGITDPSEPAPGQIQTKNKENLEPFTALKGIIDYDTFKAITVKPFKHTHMSPVQKAVLDLLPELARPYMRDPPPSPDGKQAKTRKDLLVRAKTGTGKTLAFLVPAIEARLASIKANAKQAVIDAGLTSDKHLEGRATRHFTRTVAGTIIISPTRELATQIANEALRLATHHDGFEVRLFVGGMSKRQQMRDWMKGRRDIVVATPGRLRDLLENEPDFAQGMIKCSQLILDEADTLLDMGFRQDLDAILKHLPSAPERQTFLFSATVGRNVQQIAEKFLQRDHVFINTVQKEDGPVHAHIPQYNTVLPSPEHQVPHLLRLIARDQLAHPGSSKIILFLPTTRMTQLFASLLRELGKHCVPSGDALKIYEIHSKKEQRARDEVSTRFRADKSGSSILVTTDVSARGVDYPGVTQVIQIGIPASKDQYVHRVGRTGRGSSLVGRADIVTLPWEIGFFTWQLTDVSLKPLTIAELKREVTALAEQHDADPSKFFPQSQNYRSNGFVTPVAKRLNSLEGTIRSGMETADPVALKETFASLLGYYVAKTPELRIAKSIVLEGLKAWSTGAMGLESPPYISETFLNRIGFSDGRTKRFGGSLHDFDPNKFNQTEGGSRWSGRGQQRLKGRDVTPAWARNLGVPLSSSDPDPKEYISSRYGAKKRPLPPHKADQEGSSSNEYSRPRGPKPHVTRRGQY